MSESSTFLVRMLTLGDATVERRHMGAWSVLARADAA
jgi:hypothetical protein